MQKVVNRDIIVLNVVYKEKYSFMRVFQIQKAKKKGVFENE